MTDDDLVPPSVERHTLVLLVRPADAPAFDEAELARLQREHLAYLRDLGRRGLILANGPFAEQTDERLRGLTIYAVAPDEARSLAEADPMVRAGRLAIEVVEWWTASGAIQLPATAWPRNG